MVRLLPSLPAMMPIHRHQVDLILNARGHVLRFNIFKIALVFNLTVIFNSCSGSDNRRSSASTPEQETTAEQPETPPSNANVVESPPERVPKQIMMVAFGGWNSCKTSPESQQPTPTAMNLSEPLLSLHAELQTSHGIEIPFILVCFLSDIRQAMVVHSDNRDVIRSMNIGTLYREIAEAAQRSNRSISLFGHSYGGWFGMDYVLRYGSTAAIEHLFTLDPISPASCGARDMAQMVLGQIGATPNGGSGCQISPPDFNAEDLAFIRARTGHWRHFFQNDLLSAIRTTPIDQAHSNVNINLITSESAFVMGHIRIGHSIEAWSQIRSVFQQTLGR
jgi:hypothetical protein